MRVIVVVVMLFATLSSSVASDEGGWIGREGNPVPNSDDMKSIGGFGGWLVVTPDPDWEAEWNTPTDHTPNLKTVDEVKVGEVIAILPLFINPKIDSQGFVRIHCDIQIIRPDQTFSMNEKDLDCFTYKLPGDPRSVWLSTIIPKYIGEATDQIGDWRVEVIIKDTVRNVEVPLTTTFTLVK